MAGQSIRTADLCDHAPHAARVCVAPWRSFGGRSGAAGLVATLRTFEDAGLLRHHLAQPGLGRVLVVDAGGSLQRAVLGDRMAQLGLDSGWAGVLIHGAVRDVQRLAAMDFAVFALSSVPTRGGREGTGQWAVDLCIGGAVIRAGEFLAMDADGVVLMGQAPQG